MPACTLARSVLPGTMILLCWCLGGPWAVVAEAVILPRRAVAQAPTPLSPVEKERLFQRFQRAQGATGQEGTSPAPEPVPAPPGPSTPIQPAPIPRPAQARPPSAPAPMPAFAGPAPAASAAVLRIVIHVAGGSAAEMLSTRLLANLEPRFERVELRRVAATPSQPSIRYFHSEDEAAAQDVATWLSGTGLAWTLRDFSMFRPLPSRGTIEVWLPERA